MNTTVDSGKIETAPFPAKGGFAEKWEYLLRYAKLAPSPYQGQPWLSGICDNRLDLFCDPGRTLPRGGHDARGAIINCGAALMNLRLAIQYFGYSAVVQVLPIPSDRYLVARVFLGGALRADLPGQGWSHSTRLIEEPLESNRPMGPEEVLQRVRLCQSDEEERDQAGGYNFEPTCSDERLFQAMAAGRTGGGKWRKQLPAQEALDACFNAVVHTEAWFHVILAAPERAAAAALVAQAEKEQAGDRPMRISTFGLERHQHGAEGRERRGLEVVEGVTQAPVLAVIGTEADTRAAWVEAGQALELVLLNATVAGLAVNFFNEPLEVDHLRTRFNERIKGTGFPQALLGLGYGESEARTPGARLEGALVQRV